MFVILLRKNLNGTMGNWFPIWHSEDGADTAQYLKSLSEKEANQARPGMEYKMIWSPQGLGWFRSDHGQVE